MIWTMRNGQVENWLYQITDLQSNEQRSYTLLLEAAGFKSVHIFVNLGIILWVPCVLVALIPFAWFVDTFCSVRDHSK